MGRLAILATCGLNQWALDYQGNMERILEAVRRAKASGATYLCTTELSITGYNCGDHFCEQDTEMHSWEVLAKILQEADCSNIFVDVGLPIMHKNVIYNCKLVFLNRKVLLIRPKIILANNGCVGSRETRWFTAWTKVREVEEYVLPPSIRKVTGQTTVPFGDGVLETRDTTVGYEICEELWNPESCHISQCLDGAEIISNGLGSREEYGGPGHVYQMVQMATLKNGGCYLLANQKGCDGSSGYYPGDSCIGLNGSIIAHTPLYSLEEVEVTMASIDLDIIRHYKASIRSRCIHADKSKSHPRIKVDFCLSENERWNTGNLFSCSVVPILPSKEEQILKAPACWLWDFLRRSGHTGILLPLSGNLETSSTAAIVFSMCHLIVDAVVDGNEKVLADTRNLIGNSSYIPKDAQELCGLLVYTFYSDTSSSSSQYVFETISEISQQIGSNHLNMDLGKALGILQSELSTHVECLSEQKKENNCPKDIAEQRLQQRLAEAAASFLAKSIVNPGNQKADLIVLGSSALDSGMKMGKASCGETLGDLNLIGHFTKEDIRKFLQLAKDRLKLPVLQKILDNDEACADDSMSSPGKEVSILGNLQFGEGCGPYSMFGWAWHTWKNRGTSPKEVAEKVKAFFCEYNIHQQKTALVSPTTFYMLGTGPPAYLRPLFYPRAWSWQFQAIDKAVKKMESESKRSHE